MESAVLGVGVIRQGGVGLTRLTGVELRRNFFIGTEPSFDHLSIVSTKAACPRYYNEILDGCVWVRNSRC
jgi:hypothetical protein